MTPGIPGLKLPPQQPEPPRSLSPPPGTVQFRGGGWRINLPAAVLLSAASAIGARLLPTPSQTDSAIERVQVAAERKALEDERWREEQRRQMASLQTQLEGANTSISLLKLEVQSLASAKRAP